MILVYAFEEKVSLSVCSSDLQYRQEMSCLKIIWPYQADWCEECDISKQYFYIYLSNVLSLNQRVDTLNTGCAWLCPDKHVSTVLFVYPH